MKILLCHNFYQQPGGEDQVFADEDWLLKSHGHEVIRHTVHNDAIKQMGRWETARKTLWNRQSYEQVRGLIRQHRPEVMHCHNTFPLISPAAYSAARDEGVPVVQSLHNYRLICPTAIFLRKGQICERCLGKTFAWPGVMHGCYRGSRACTAIVAAMTGLHRLLGTWSSAVERYIALSNFSRDKLVAGGLPADRTVVKPNFVYPDPHPGEGRGGHALFVGRLSEEKGLAVLLAAWQRLGAHIPLKIVGDGPLADSVKSTAAGDPRIECLGRKSPAETLDLLGQAAFVVLPSIWYENCPKTVVEALAKGTPIVASRLGALAEFVDDGRTGLLFAPGDADDLARKVEELARDPGRLVAMRAEARREYEEKYTADQNYPILMEIYRQAIAGQPSSGAPSGPKAQLPAPHLPAPGRTEPKPHSPEVRATTTSGKGQP
jgi:glycosyltransferase involved in cell wall biosynthesis